MEGSSFLLRKPFQSHDSWPGLRRYSPVRDTGFIKKVSETVLFRIRTNKVTSRAFFSLLKIALQIAQIAGI